MAEVVEIHATRDQIEEFKDSVLWKDIVTELESWKEGFRRELNGLVDEIANTNPSTASVLTHLGDLNGRQKAIDYVTSILDVFLEIIEDRAKRSVGDETDQNLNELGG